MTETKQTACTYPFTKPASVSDVIDAKIQSEIDTIIANDPTLKPDYATTTYEKQLKSVNHYAGVMEGILKNQPNNADYSAASLETLKAAWSDRMNGGGNVFEKIIPNDPKKTSIEPAIVTDWVYLKLARQKAATDGNYAAGGYYHLDSIQYMKDSPFFMDIWFMQDNVNVVIDQMLQPLNQYVDPYLPNSHTAPTVPICCLSGTGGTVDNLGGYISGVGRIVQWHLDRDGKTKAFERLVEGKTQYTLSNGYVRYFDNLFTYKDTMFFGQMGSTNNLMYKYITFDTTKVVNFGYNNYGSTSIDMSKVPDNVEEFTDFNVIK